MTTDIVDRLRTLRGPWIGDGISPAINAYEVADQIELLETIVKDQAAELGRLSGGAPDGPLGVLKPIVLVRDRVFEGSGLEVGLWDQTCYWMPDGDGFKRDGDTLDGMPAQFLSPIELAKLLEPPKTASGLQPERSDRMDKL